ncbi:MAG TPA: hypothetical protein VII09_01925 [Opitutaceae bacterium]
MKNAAVLALVYILSPAVCWCADRAANLRHDAAACIGAWNSGRYSQVVSCLSERVVPDARARASALAEIKDSFVFGGMQIDSIQVTLGKVPPPRKYRTLYASVFPVFAVVKGLGFQLTDTGYVLGVSKDDGRTWKFVPLMDYDPLLFNRQFPEFEGRIAVPATIPPTLEPNI